MIKALKLSKWVFFFLRIFPENEVETRWGFKNICVFLWKCYYMAYYGAMDLKKSNCRYKSEASNLGAELLSKCWEMDIYRG